MQQNRKGSRRQAATSVEISATVEGLPSTRIIGPLEISQKTWFKCQEKNGWSDLISAFERMWRKNVKKIAKFS